MTTRNRKQRMSVEGVTLTLADLRWLVDNTGDWDEKSRVNVTYYAGDQRESEYALIEVAGDETGA